MGEDLRAISTPTPEGLEFLLVESAVRQLYGLYADALRRKDTDAFVACFAPDAIWKIAGLTLGGRSEIGDLFGKYMSATEAIMMFTGLPVVTVDGEALGRVQVTEHIKLRNGAAVRTLGVYYDRYVVDGDRLCFGFHHFNLYHYGPPDFSEPNYECREYGPPPGMPGPDDPTTVRRPA